MQVLLPTSAVAASAAPAAAAPRTLQQLHPEHAMLLPGQQRNLHALHQWQQQQQRVAAAAAAAAAAGTPGADVVASLAVVRRPADTAGTAPP